MNIRLTLMADLHGKHHEITNDLPGGDFILCAGDLTPRGYLNDINDFCQWYNNLNNYHYKIFIAGNHDFGFQRHPDDVKNIINQYENIIYLQDNTIELWNLKIYGTPWQPKFYNWAFNLPRNGEDLKEKWNKIPDDVDILITHGPPFGILDTDFGCELLTERLNHIKPKIHLFGHIHSGYGHHKNENTNFFNAALMNEKYIYSNKPFTIDLDIENNEIIFL